MRPRLRIALLPLLATMLACESPLSPGTEGPPMFRAAVDHQPWPPADSPAVFTASVSVPGALTIVAAIRTTDGHTRHLMGMSIPDFHGPGRYPLSSAQTAPWALLRRTGDAGAEVFVSGADDNDFIQITAIDTLTRIVAGTFGFTARSAGGVGTTVEVTGGSFRVPYATPAPAGAEPVTPLLFPGPPGQTSVTRPAGYH